MALVLHLVSYCGFPGGSDCKEAGCNAGDPDLIPESGRSSKEGNGSPLQYSCLENSRDRGVWQGLKKALSGVVLLKRM